MAERSPVLVSVAVFACRFYLRAADDVERSPIFVGLLLMLARRHGGDRSFAGRDERYRTGPRTDGTRPKSGGRYGE